MLCKPGHGKFELVTGTLRLVPQLGQAQLAVTKAQIQQVIADHHLLSTPLPTNCLLCLIRQQSPNLPQFWVFAVRPYLQIRFRVLGIVHLVQIVQCLGRYRVLLGGRLLVKRARCHGSHDHLEVVGTLEQSVLQVIGHQVAIVHHIA